MSQSQSQSQGQDINLNRNQKKIKFNLSQIISTFFYVGLIPKAPGTWGTLAAIPLVLLLNYGGPFWIMGFVILSLPISVYAIKKYQEIIGGSEDPGEIVIWLVFMLPMST